MQRSLGSRHFFFDLLLALDSDHDTYLDLRRSLQSFLNLQNQSHDTHIVEKELMGPFTAILQAT